MVQEMRSRRFIGWLTRHDRGGFEPLGGGSRLAAAAMTALRGARARGHGMSRLGCDGAGVSTWGGRASDQAPERGGACGESVRGYGGARTGSCVRRRGLARWGQVRAAPIYQGRDEGQGSLTRSLETLAFHFDQLTSEGGRTSLRRCARGGYLSEGYNKDVVVIFQVPPQISHAICVHHAARWTAFVVLVDAEVGSRVHDPGTIVLDDKVRIHWAPLVAISD